MTQEEGWMRQYREVMEFIETNHRNPSKYRAEERNYYNFVKWGVGVAECGGDGDDD